MTIDYAAEYNNRARVPEYPEIMAGWARDAASYRTSARAERDLAYGESDRCRIDIFHPAGNASGALVVFVHGGYWRSLDKDQFSHLAAGLNAHGLSVALPGYDLCPAVTIRDIVDEMRAAVSFLHRHTGQRRVMTGHSAGGHLAAALVATDWSALDPSLPADVTGTGLAISGLFDLLPLIETPLNEDLRLGAAEAKAMSPLWWPVPHGRRLEAWVGGDESSEYLRQARSVAEMWTAGGARTGWEAIPGANHFTAIAPLTDPASPMVARIVEMARSP